jgi:hypothetical protein
MGMPAGGLEHEQAGSASPISSINMLWASVTAAADQAPFTGGCRPSYPNRIRADSVFRAGRTAARLQYEIFDTARSSSGAALP